MAFLAAILCAQPARTSQDYTSQSEVSPHEPGYTYREIQHQRTLEGRERYRKRVAIPYAVRPLSPLAGPGGWGSQAFRRTQVPETPMGLLERLAWVGLLGATGTLLARKLAPRIAASINAQFNLTTQSRAAGPGLAASVRAEEEAFAEFLAAFSVGDAAPPAASTSVISASADGSQGLVPLFNPVVEFLEAAPGRLASLRKRLQEIGRCQIEAPRQQMLAGLGAEFRTLKGEAALSEWLPIWQMAAALEGLVRQLTERSSTVTPSTLRTVASALDLLEDLCRPGVRPDLCTNPPIRLLAVDDDLISRRAIEYALKRAFSRPDLAESAADALPLIAECFYDVIFLDVLMPGMDGFELCSKIHAQGINQATPVIFVTCLTDFSARAQSILAGGNDLIAKPFLTFEITVKALTLALRGRLQGREPGATAHAATTPDRLNADPHEHALVVDAAVQVVGVPPTTDVPSVPIEPVPALLPLETVPAAPVTFQVRPAFTSSFETETHQDTAQAFGRWDFSRRRALSAAW
ncbi:hypothetical protein SBV1_2630038 [Verrucomicrobia bacterium]|nr:hypothetical protein SBV1_2630038 [Verrucomicrobiota bacterium]